MPFLVQFRVMMLSDCESHSQRYYCYKQYVEKYILYNITYYNIYKMYIKYTDAHVNYVAIKK